MDDDEDLADGDPGLFGPGSVTWRLHADPLMGLAGLRALLLQALHPGAMAAFESGSRYRDDLWGRLSRTAEYVAVTTYGSCAEAMTAAARVRAVHATVAGVSPEGRPYRADDPELLRWVHCCLVDSFLSVPVRGGVSCTQEEQDRYVAEQVASAVLVGLDPEDVPTTVAQVRATLREFRPRLRAGGAARSAALFLIVPPMPNTLLHATAARPAWASLAGLAFAALPSWARGMYALPEPPPSALLKDAAVTVALHTLRTTLRGVSAAVPALREPPQLRSARLRLVPPPS
ncbi:MAG: oxygenase MpaB family protein [Kineosporiaceae bacterium]